MTLVELKKELMEKYQGHLEPEVLKIEKGTATHDEQAKLVNKAINDYRGTLVSGLGAKFSDAKDKQQAFIVLQYCTTVVSLEYRHRVWPYEYMALSRRVGELWERVCSTAWDNPSRANVKRIAAPSFTEVEAKLKKQISDRIDDPVLKEELSADVDILFDLVGKINMVEDVVFTVDGVPHVIDFKSGFGSNEKGNMLRLQTVGKAYRLWNPDTRLLFLVRQEDNNNYLNVIKKSQLWEVHCGTEAYKMIDELTGSDMTTIRESIIDFKGDLSSKCWADLNSHLSDLTSYLLW